MFTGCIKWIRSTFPRIRDTSGFKLWLWDSCRVHLPVREKLASHHVDIALIPGGLRPSRLQPLYVSINKPFKSGVHRAWKYWMISGKQGFTEGGHHKAPSKDLISSWAFESWNTILAKMNAKSFKKTAISALLTAQRMASCMMIVGRHLR